MEKNFNFRALAFFFASTFAVSSVNATDLSFFQKHKKAIIAGTVIVLTTAATAYYFRNNLSEVVSSLFKLKSDSGTVKETTSNPSTTSSNEPTVNTENK